MLMPSIYLVRPNFLNVKRSFLLNLSIQKRYSRSVTDVSHLLQARVKGLKPIKNGLILPIFRWIGFLLLSSHSDPVL